MIVDLENLQITLAAHHQPTADHEARVSALIDTLPIRLGIEELNKIKFAALHHDVGKVFLPEKLLEKALPLNRSECILMQMHPIWGAEATFDDPSTSSIILSHHERWDGLGYPFGRAGEDIPLGARILAIVDAFDAMTNLRAYRTPQSHNHALNEITAQAGKQFDPELCRIILPKWEQSLSHFQPNRSETASRYLTDAVLDWGAGQRLEQIARVPVVARVD
jgi:HD-GYP domain-containing protein (c-di-GMP phosphodiesterase class II)